MMTPDWIAEERRLWDKMYAKPKISDNKRNSRMLGRLKKAGRRVPDDYITEAQAVARSWNIYQVWINH